MAEEIGCSGTLRLLLKWYLAPGYSTELMHVFVATNLREITRGLLDDDENIEIKEMTLSAAIEKCINGNIEDAKTIARIASILLQSVRLNRQIYFFLASSKLFLSVLKP